MSRNKKYLIAFEKHTAQWKVGKLKADGTITNALSSSTGIESWPHLIVDWKYFDNESLGWASTDETTSILFNECKKQRFIFRGTQFFLGLPS